MSRAEIANLSVQLLQHGWSEERVIELTEKLIKHDMTVMEITTKTLLARGSNVVNQNLVLSFKDPMAENEGIYMVEQPLSELDGIWIINSDADINKALSIRDYRTIFPLSIPGLELSRIDSGSTIFFKYKLSGGQRRVQFIYKNRTTYTIDGIKL